jgi:[NiFe] hydrogenase assembly HybE family chaperone
VSGTTQDRTVPMAGSVPEPVAALLAARVRELEALFERIASTRMQGVPILHPRLSVEAVGFRPSAGGRAAVGVLVTPWFMNLVWLPLQPAPASPASPAADAADADRAASDRSPSAAPPEPATPVGVTRTRAVGNERFDFIGAREPGFGAYEACSLFSPMSEFADQAAAVATAEQVMRLLHPPQPLAGADAAPDLEADDASAPEAAPSRRALLFGRAAAAAPGSPR